MRGRAVACHFVDDLWTSKGAHPYEDGAFNPVTGTSFGASPEIGFAGKFQRLESCTTSARGVAIRHHVNRDVGLLFSLNPHSDANLIHEPALKFRARFYHAAAHDQGVRVEGVDHLIEKQSKRPRLDPENLLAHRIALLRHSAYAIGSLVRIFDFAQFVTGIFLQEMRQQMSPNRSERTQRFQVSQATAIALWDQSFGAGNHLIRNEDVAELSAEPLPALDHRAIHDDSASMTGTNNARNRGGSTAHTEESKMSPDGRGVRVVQVHHGFIQNLGEIAAHIETRPIGMNKIRRALCAEHPRRARRARCVEAYNCHIRKGIDRKS